MQSIRQKWFYLFHTVLIVWVFLGPSIIMKTFYIIFDPVPRFDIMAIMWFSFLAIRTFILLYFVLLLIRSFRLKRSLIKVACMVLILIEIPFSLSFNSLGYMSFPTLNWFSMYWHPFNSYGYRDVEPRDPSECSFKVVITGDSYSSGAGIKCIEDRYDQILKKKLGDTWCIYNASGSGMDSKEELTSLKTYPFRGDYIIFQYYINDLDGSMKAFNISFPDPPEAKYETNPFVTATAIGNQLFFKYAHLFYVQEGYSDVMKAAYDNQEVLDDHYKDLAKVSHFADSTGAKLIVLIYPELTDLELSNNIYVSRIVGFFQDKAYAVIDVSDLVKQMPVKERVVSMIDAHGSEKVHLIVANKLFEVINESRTDIWMQ